MDVPEVQAQPRQELPAAPAPDPEVLRIQGDQTMDRLAERMGWAGRGSLADPYVIDALVLEAKTLVLQDLSRIVVLQGADLTGPADGAALVVWNVSGLRIVDSTIVAQGGPAVAFLESLWCTVETNTLRSDEEAIQATASQAIDVMDNRLEAGTTGLRTIDDRGDHWIEQNQVKAKETGILLDGGDHSSLITGNTIEADTAIHVRDAPGPLIEENRLNGRDGVRLERAPGAAILSTAIEATRLGIAATASDELVAEGIVLKGGGRGVELSGGHLTILANLTYDGPGPAVDARGGDTVVVVDPQILLDGHSQDAVRFQDTITPVVLDGSIGRGRHAVVLNATHAGSVIGTEIHSTTQQAILAANTEGTVIAEAWFMGHGVKMAGGTGHQVAENVFMTASDWAIEVRHVRDAYMGHNQVEQATAGIFSSDSESTLIEGNAFNQTLRGIEVTRDRNATIRNNVLSATQGGIRVTDHPAGGTLLVEGNQLLAVQAVGLTLEAVDSFQVGTNALMTERRTGLALHDVKDGVIYDNWFDNLVNIAASGTMDDVAWQVAETPGTNIAGGPLIAGNWWNSYFGADLDGDGIGDIPYTTAPYDDDVSRFVGPVPNYGVEDETPLVADEPVPGLPSALPAPPAAEERLASLLGLHPKLDALVETRL